MTPRGSVTSKKKARCKWALEGDENSGFLHGLLNKNLRSQRISGININWFWTTNPVEVKEEAVKHFSIKFMETEPSRPSFTSHKFKNLSIESSLELETPISFNEVQSVVWLSGSDKSLGP